MPNWVDYAMSSNLMPSDFPDIPSDMMHPVVDFQDYIIKDDQQ